MVRWKILEKLRSKSNESESEETIELENNEENEESILAEHHETLLSGAITTKKNHIDPEGNIISSEQRIWRDLNAIEENIDNLNLEKKKDTLTAIDETVDMVLSKYKK